MYLYRDLPLLHYYSKKRHLLFYIKTTYRKTDFMKSCYPIILTDFCIKIKYKYNFYIFCKKVLSIHCQSSDVNDSNSASTPICIIPSASSGSCDTIDGYTFIFSAKLRIVPSTVYPSFMYNKILFLLSSLGFQ